jgi:hypothetical protein
MRYLGTFPFCIANLDSSIPIVRGCQLAGSRTMHEAGQTIAMVGNLVSEPESRERILSIYEDAIRRRCKCKATASPRLQPLSATFYY